MKKLLIILFTFTSFFCRAQWQDLGSGISIPSYDMFAMDVVDANTVWAVGNTWPTYAQEFTKTIDGGNTWQVGMLPSLSGNYFSLSIKAIDADTAWVLMTIIPTQDSSRLFKTNDGGSSWTEQFGGFNQKNWALAIMHFFDGNNGVLYGSSGTGAPSNDSLHIHTTSDGGATWTRVPASNLPTPLAGEGNWISSGNGNYAAVGDTMWATSRAQRVFKTTDKGLTWQAFSVGGSANLLGVAFQDPMNGVVVGSTPNYIGTTNDGGATWTDVTTILPLALENAHHIPGSNGTYISWAAGDEDLAISRDNGATWISINQGEELNCIEFVSPTVGYGGNIVITDSTGGMHKWTGDISVSIKDLVRLKGLNFYPNPTRNTFVIKANEKIKSEIIIFDLQGEKLVQSTMNQKQHSIDVSHLPKGIYLLQMDVDGDRINKSFIIK